MERQKEDDAAHAREFAADRTQTSHVSGSRYATPKRYGPSQQGPSLLSKIGKILQKITRKLFPRQYQNTRRRG